MLRQASVKLAKKRADGNDTQVFRVEAFLVMVIFPLKMVIFPLNMVIFPLKMVEFDPQDIAGRYHETMRIHHPRVLQLILPKLVMTFTGLAMVFRWPIDRNRWAMAFCNEHGGSFHGNVTNNQMVCLLI